MNATQQGLEGQGGDSSGGEEWSGKGKGLTGLRDRKGWDGKGKV